MKPSHWLLRLPATVLVALVRAYQLCLSPWLGPCCRFHPSCSEYFIRSVKKHGALRGGLRGMGRIVRCNPLCKGGFDPP